MGLLSRPSAMGGETTTRPAVRKKRLAPALVLLPTAYTPTTGIATAEQGGLRAPDFAAGRKKNLTPGLQFEVRGGQRCRRLTKMKCYPRPLRAREGKAAEDSKPSAGIGARGARLGQGVLQGCR